MTTAIRYAATFGLLGALALPGAMPAAAQIPAALKGGSPLAQYCVPSYDATDLHRIYCRDGG
jgi:hypothetical protein